MTAEPEEVWKQAALDRAVALITGWLTNSAEDLTPFWVEALATTESTRQTLIMALTVAARLSARLGAATGETALEALQQAVLEVRRRPGL